MPAEGYICPTGHYCVEGSLFELGCDIGYYQDSQGQASCKICPAGKMCPESNMTNPVDCQSGRLFGSLSKIYFGEFDFYKFETFLTIKANWQSDE